MADVFISYTRADQPFVERLAHVLGSSGISVWYDRKLTVGEEYGKEIEQELRAASACVVIWSAVSVDRPWVRSEANLGHNLGKLVPVMIENCNIPLPFNGFHSYSLQRDGELSLQSPAVLAIQQQVRQLTQRVRNRRRDVAVSADGVKRKLIDMARYDPDCPGDFIESHSVTLEGPTFYPLLVGSIDWRGDVTASIGYDREEEYTEQEERKDPATNQPKLVPVKKKRKVTTWAPYAAPMSGSLDVVLPGAAVLEPMARALKDFSHASAFLQEELPERAAVIEPQTNILSVPANNDMIHEQVVSSVKSKLPGDKNKDLRVTKSINPSAMKVLYVPLWHGKVGYGGQEHDLVASGLDAADISFEMPKDQALVADRGKRETMGSTTFGSGVVAAGIGGATNYWVLSPVVSGALGATSIVAGIWMLIWPFVDMSLGRQIREREQANADRRTRAVAALGPSFDASSGDEGSTTKTGFRFGHGMSLLAGLVSVGWGAWQLIKMIGL